MVLGYIVAWTPYAVIGSIIALQTSPHLPYWITVLAPLVAKSSTTYNPIIYYLMVKRFRRNIWKLLTCVKNPSETREIRTDKNYVIYIKQQVPQTGNL